MTAHPLTEVREENAFLVGSDGTIDVSVYTAIVGKKPARPTHQFRQPSMTNNLTMASSQMVSETIKNGFVISRNR